MAARIPAHESTRIRRLRITWHIPRQDGDHALGDDVVFSNARGPCLHSRMRTMLALPAESLCAIFAHLPLRDRIAATHVCWTWRKVALEAAAELWSQISWGPSHFQVLVERLARAGGAPIDLRLDVTPQRLLAAADIVASYIGQLRSLTIHLGQLGTAGHFPAETAPLASLLTRSSPAPLLESLSVRVDSEASVFSLNAPLFQNVTPNLKFVDFDGVEYVRKDAHHPTVSSLRLSARSLYIPWELDRRLGPFPGLELLDVRSARYQVMPGSIAALPEQLREIVLRFPVGQPISPEVLARIPHGSIKLVEYSVCG